MYVFMYVQAKQQLDELVWSRKSENVILEALAKLVVVSKQAAEGASTKPSTSMDD